MYSRTGSSHSSKKKNTKKNPAFFLSHLACYSHPGKWRLNKRVQGTKSNQKFLGHQWLRYLSLYEWVAALAFLGGESLFQGCCASPSSAGRRNDRAKGEGKEGFHDRPTARQDGRFTNHPLQTPNMHTQNWREKERAHEGLRETEDGDMEQEARLRTLLSPS